MLTGGGRRVFDPPAPPSRNIFGAIAATSALLLAGCYGNASLGDQVEFADLERAADLAAICIEDAGFEVDGPRPGAGGVGLVVGAYVAADATEQEVNRAYATTVRCWETHAQAISDAYVADLQLFGAERDQAYESMIVCLESAGVYGVSVGDPEEVVGEAVYGNDEALDCLQSKIFAIFGPEM